MKTQPHRYKLCEQKFLPKFAPAGRPVSFMPAPVQEKSSLRAEPLFHKNAASPPPADPASALSPQKRGGARSIAVSEVHSPAAEAAQAMGRPAWKIFGSRPSARAARALVQCELSLDQVKVMRNDLNETDLEIVPAQPARQAVRHASQPARETRALPSLEPAREKRALPSFAQPVQPAARHAPVMSDGELKLAAGRVWSRLTAQLFEADGQQR